jgi:hypothetical protein
MAALAGCGRHRDARDGEDPQVWRKAGTRPDFRDPEVREKPHLADPVTEMPGTSRFRASLVLFRAREQGPKARCVFLAPYRGVNPRSASVTVGQHARKTDLPHISLTRSLFRHGPVAPHDSPASLPPLPTDPAVSATATACQGRGRDGRVPRTSRRQLQRPHLSPGQPPPPPAPTPQPPSPLRSAGADDFGFRFRPVFELALDVDLQLAVGALGADRVVGLGAHLHALEDFEAE